MNKNYDHKSKKNGKHVIFYFHYSVAHRYLSAHRGKINIKFYFYQKFENE